MNTKVLSALLVLLLTGCATQQSGLFGAQDDQDLAASSNEAGVEEVDTSDWKVYESENLGVRLKFPEDWGSLDVINLQSPPSPFNGEVIAIRFDKIKLTANIFGDDSTIKPTEGTTGVFNPHINMLDSISSIADKLSSHKNISNYPYGFFHIESIKKVSLRGIPGVYLIHDTGIVQTDLRRSFLFPNFFESFDGRNHVRVDAWIGDPAEEVMLRNEPTFYNMTGFLSTLERFE